ncbi:MAG: esterase-like activity of phytase family protein [Verrucomicrobiota bacterium]
MRHKSEINLGDSQQKLPVGNSRTSTVLPRGAFFTNAVLCLSLAFNSAYAAAPTVTTQPTSATILVGGTQTLSVVGAGTLDMSYQWYKGAKSTTTDPITGGTSASLTVTGGTSALSYWARITNADGTVDSNSATVATVPEIYTSSSRDVLKANTTIWPTSGVTLEGTKFVNLGLQGMGRIPANSIDPATGESLGSISDMQLESFVNQGGGVWGGTFSFLPDRGYNSGTTFSNYAARINRVSFTFTPYTGTSATTQQNQIAMTFLGSTRFTYDHDSNSATAPVYTTGLLATGTLALFNSVVPVVSGTVTQSDGTVTNRLTVDAEGLALDRRPGRSGTGWVSDEYGPNIYHFNANKQIDGLLKVPDVLVPRDASRNITFVADGNITTGTGRRTNQGMEGLAVSPDGTRLFALMQSATLQDADPTTNNQKSTAARLLIYDISTSDTPSDPVAQYVVELPRLDQNGTLTNGTTVDKTAAQSSIVALNSTQLLILTRDGNGRGSSRAPVFKSIVLADLSKATNIDGTYDAEGASIATAGVLKAGITPMAWTQAVNLIGGLGDNALELAKFGMNINTAPGDLNTLGEKWEGLGLVSAQDPANPNDYFLFVGNDNDFLTASGKLLDANNVLQSYDAGLENDTIVLAYRVRIENAADVAVYTGGAGNRAPVKLGQTAAVNFGSVDALNSGTQTFTMVNPGNSVLTSVSAKIDGADSSQFTVTSTVPTVIYGGESISITVRFAPNGPGVKSAVLHLLSSAPGTKASIDIPLSGVGATKAQFDLATSGASSRYVVPVDNTWDTKAILTVGESVPLTGGSAGQTYTMVGIPDGLGVYDNGNGTMTVLMNHELANNKGVVRAHGAVGAFVSEWIINKSTLQVLSGSDLIRRVYDWDKTNQKSESTTSTVAFNRLCSADLAPVSAFFNPATGLGTQARLFLNGEEGGATGFALAHVATGASKGSSYVLGKFNLATDGSNGTAVGGWENLLANPFAQDKTVVIGNNDGGTGVMSNTVAVYVGTKTNSGTEADKAGLTNGTIRFVNVSGNPVEIVNPITRTTEITSGTRFTLSSTASTTFSRPEDGAWNPMNFREFYFATTDRLDQVADGLGTQIGRTRLWRLTFDDIKSPESGGFIDLMLEGGVGNDATMWDNLTITADGKVVLQEDPGNAQHNAKIWFFDPVTHVLTKVLKHDPARFGDVGVDAVAPFTVDEESSGIVDVTPIYTATPGFGDRYYLFVEQAHTTDFTGVTGASTELVERGQLLLARQFAVESGPSTTTTPYLLPVDPSVKTAAILTVGDVVPKTGSSTETYQMVGIPDGLGSYDNGDGTFTLLVNHELASNKGAVRAHGAVGAFVSEWIVKKSTLRVISGSDLIKSVYPWDSVNQVSSGTASTVAFNRFCSADLPPVTAFYNSASGLGTQARLFMNGEEGGSTGYALAHVATGASKGKSYVLGKFNLATDGSNGTAVGGWENLLANPFAQDKTVVIGNNDGGTGVMLNTVAVYVGTKTNTGSEVDKAGLTNGVVKFVTVAGQTAELADTTTRATNIANGTRFTLTGVGTTFSRPEDGAWNPTNPRQYYFVTTDQLDAAGLGLGTNVGRSRLWRLTFDDITNPAAGGSIDLLVEGGVGNNATMWDNLTVNGDGKLLLQEDPGNSAHNAKVWMYDPVTKALTVLLQHDPARFGSATLAHTAPFNVDEESSGIIEVTDLGVGAPKASERTYLLAQQAHTTDFTGISGSATELVERGQIVLMRQSTNVATAQTVAADLAVYSKREGFTNTGARILNVDVVNVGNGPTDGTAVSVNLDLPVGLTVLAATGDGWTVNTASGRVISVRRSDVLWPGTAYPRLVVTYTVDDVPAAGVPVPVKISGGGDNNMANNVFTETPGLSTGISSSDTPYLQPLNNLWQVSSLLTVGDAVPLTGGTLNQKYRMVGIPDGLGAYDNGDGTITVLMNHELGSNKGTVRTHGAIGAFVSEWIINKSTLKVVSGSDLIRKVYGWDKVNQKSESQPSTIAFNRMCSADLAAGSAFFNPASGLGTQARLFLNGEEGGATGFALAHVASGAAKGNSYILGKFNPATDGSGGSAVGGWENLVANPVAQDKTVVIGTNDGGTGVANNTVAVYVGTKTNNGSEVDKAGLTNGVTRFVNVAGNPVEIVNTTTRATEITNGLRFTLSASAGTTFSRPEDGAWNPANPREFYFATTDRLDQLADGVGSQIGRTRLWRLTFDDVRSPELGGTIDLMAEGGNGNDATMWDNLTVTTDGKVVLQEDPGNAVHNAKVWFFDPATRALTKVLRHDPARFGDTTLAASSPFNVDEESSGVIEVSSLFGGNTGFGDRYYLIAQQAHTENLTGLTTPTEIVERGQLLLVHQIAAEVGPSSTSTPYILPLDGSMKTSAVLTVGDSVLKTGSTTGETYTMVGIPDGLGAYDNGDGSFTLLMNHELGSDKGVVRAHGAAGAFVSEWIIRKSTMRVVSGSDLIRKVYGWDKVNQRSEATTSVVAFNRLCSADLAAVSAFYNPATGLGTQARLFLNGEEGGAAGYALATVATGASKGNTYILGKFNLATDGSVGGTAIGGWENLVANPYAQDKTVVAATNDGGTSVMSNTVGVYVGTKTNTGSEADKAGLTNGAIKFVTVTGNPKEITNTTTRATSITNGTRFTLSGVGTTFSRPEDGAWNPLDPRQFYFVTTDQLNAAGLGLGANVGRTRLWRLTFDNIGSPDFGGTIDLLLEGGVGNDATMWDNMTVTADGKLLLQEDPGNTVHNAKVWLFDPVSKTLTKVLQHDPARFGTSVIPASYPFTVDEESSGVIDVTDLGVGGIKAGERAYLMVQQAHGVPTTTELVEGGQLVLVRHASGAGGPDLVVSSASTGVGTDGNKQYVINVRNVGDAPTDGSLVEISEELPTGLSAVSLSGTGWSVISGVGSKINATRSDVLEPGASYPELKLSVAVAAGVSLETSNKIKVAGGGDKRLGNNEFVERAVTQSAYKLQAAVNTVSETAGKAVLTVVRRGTGVLPAADVTVGFTDGSAKAGQDYTGTSLKASFVEGGTSATVNVPITDRKGTPQGSRTFSVLLKEVPAGSLIEGTPVVLTITDAADGTGAVTGGSISFASAEVTVSPVTQSGSASIVSVVLNREGAASGTVEVSVRVLKDAALPNGVTTRLTSAADFTLPSDSAVVKFADGQLTAALQIPLKAKAHGGAFVLGLADPKAALLGSRQQMTVKVGERDDLKPTLTVNFGTPSSGGEVVVGGTVSDTGANASGLNKLEYILVNGTDKGTVTAVTVAGDGKFTQKVQLQPGANKLTLSAYDKAGNVTTASKSITFADSTGAQRAGTYDGVLKPESGVSSGLVSNDTVGLISVTVSKAGLLTGQLRLGGFSTAFKGIVDASGSVYFDPGLGRALHLEDKTEWDAYLGGLSLSFEGAVLNATLNPEEDGGVLATATMRRRATAATGLIASGTVQKFVLAIEAVAPEDLADSEYPHGSGTGIMTVKSTGAVAVAGVLPDGTSYTTGGWLSEAEAGVQSAAIHQSLYRNGGAIASELKFDLSPTAHADSDVLDVDGVWVRPVLKTYRSYKNGWETGLTLNITGTRFTPAAASASTLGGLAAENSNAQLAFEGGLLTTEKTLLFDLGAKDVFVNRSADANLRLEVFRDTGLFSGVFTHTDTKKTTFLGVILQKGANTKGYGFFMSAPSQSLSSAAEGGSVILSPVK